jgi:beta-galactosidase/beta-glucuronidase
MSSQPRAEYPRPQFVREEWLNLNGIWNFEFDDENRGLLESWFVHHTFSKQIIVPYAFQSELSGIGDTTYHDVVWYHRTFAIPDHWVNKHIVLHFGAVDYRAWVWVNGVQAAYHEGGHTPFQLHVTPFLREGNNEVILRVEDLSTNMEQPRGKQYWEPESGSIFYTRTTGIWQTVWLEALPSVYYEWVKFTPNIHTGELEVEYRVNQAAANQQFEIDIYFSGNKIASDSDVLQNTLEKARRIIQLSDFSKGNGRLWSPETPQLYDVVLRITENGHVLDEVKSYMGMRSISNKDGMIQLNDKPYYMKLVLDQGYFPKGILTAPTDDDLKKDIELCIEMGFNGARKHQKVEDPRYLYWADQLGFLVWGEMANCHVFTSQGIRRMTGEWQDAVERDYNHPCIVAWVPLNESWGVPNLKSDVKQIHHTLSMYHLTKSLDSTRLVIANDGWEHTATDILGIHDYESKKNILIERYRSMDNILASEPGERVLYTPGFVHEGQPVIVTEFGGIAFQKSEWKGWGYSAATNDDDFLERYECVVSAMLESPLVQGFCYTQITDVEQEINGLLTYDRKPKVPLHKIRKINQGKSIHT